MTAKVSTLPAGSLSDANGKPSPQFVAYLQKLERLLAEAGTLEDVSPVTPGNTDPSVTFRVFTDTDNNVTGTDPGLATQPIGYAGGGTSIFDSFTRLANAVTALYQNDANLDAAIADINTRLTAVENKMNDIIAALTP